jgi:PAS domain S-box-containing protein
MTVAIPPVASLGEVLDTAPCGFVSFTDNGDIRLINRTLCDLLGIDPEDVTGRSMESLLTIPTRIFYQTHFFPLLKLHGRADEIFLTLKASNGDHVDALANAVRRERDGEWLNECVIMRIQERSKFEDALIRAKKAAEEANVARMRFLSMMSHDLRTPLNAISGYAELMLMGIRGKITPDQEKDLLRMKDASTFLLNLLNDVLAFVKFEAGQIDISMRDVRLSDVIAQAEALVAPRIMGTDITYSSSNCHPGLRVRADDSRLQQVLLNLLTNALKFTPRGGTVTLSCVEEPDRVLLRVADNGPGIPAERIAWIFEPFTQVEKQSKGAQEGVGLGLAISRQLARAMGGDVSVVSEPGAGAIFTISLQRSGSG